MVGVGRLFTAGGKCGHAGTSNLRATKSKTLAERSDVHPGRLNRRPLPTMLTPPAHGNRPILGKVAGTGAVVRISVYLVHDVGEAGAGSDVRDRAIGLHA